MALDGDDFETVRLLLAHDCVYDLGDQSHVGADAIVKCYANGSKLALDLFDSVDYSHELIGTVDERTVRVHFIDSLGANGETHVHVSRQDVTVDPGRGVVRIVDTSEPGQQQAVDTFMARHGITRPTTD